MAKKKKVIDTKVELQEESIELVENETVENETVENEIVEVEQVVESVVESNEIEIEQELPKIVEQEIKQDLPKIEEELLDYISKNKEDEVELNDILSKLNNDEDDFIVAKKSYQLLTKMSAEGKIKMADFNWRELSQHYHEMDGRAKKYLLSDIKILAKK